MPPDYRHENLALKGAATIALAAILITCGRGKPSERAGMVYIPPGEFLMGSRADDPKVYDWEKPHEQPQHPVDVKGFFIDLHEVTNAEYERFAPGHQRNANYSPCDECPVTDVNWFEAQRFCAGQQPPKRLPTEAEWEKAAKGGSEKDPEPFGDYAWFSGNSIKRTQPVMQKKPNGYGLFDTVGNVREWTGDWYGPTYYEERASDNPKGPTEGRRRVERGGAFFLPARGVTTTIRYNHPPDFRLYFLGFRCAADAP